MLARTMAFFVLCLAAVSILITFALVVSDTFVSSMVDFFNSNTGLQLSAALCLVLGVSFLLAVPAVKFPLIFKIIGVVALIEAPLFLVVPMHFVSDYVNFWLVENLLVYRIVAVPFGIGPLVFLIVAAYPVKRVTHSESSENET
jgi:hypothetical protein